jgi:hypothetical protein
MADLGKPWQVSKFSIWGFICETGAGHPVSYDLVAFVLLAASRAASVVG